MHNLKYTFTISLQFQELKNGDAAVVVLSVHPFFLKINEVINNYVKTVMQVDCAVHTK